MIERIPVKGILSLLLIVPAAGSIVHTHKKGQTPHIYVVFVVMVGATGFEPAAF
jgi:hypothetical protein